MNSAQKSAPSRPLFQSATSWLRLLKDRQIGAVELLNLHVEQYVRHNGSLNAVVATDLESALSAARAADNTMLLARGPLHGLPMTIKDSFEVAGMPATCGMPFLVNHLPQRDADAVARLKAAGAIVYGKTNVPPGAFDWQSFNPIYGTTNNPWNLERTPGGSSGGPAAAVAAGFAPLELGSDIGGSIRVPAAFCGIYGHKPTWGIVPLRGHIPPVPGHGEHLRVDMGVGGPLARSAKDLELALDVLVAAGELERTAWRVSVPPSRHERLQDFRVALWVDREAYDADENLLAAIDVWAAEVERLGVKIDRKARPKIDWKSSFDTYITTLFQLMGAGAPPEVIEHMINGAGGAPSESYPAKLAKALSLRHHEYFGLMYERERLYLSWRDFFVDHDLLICPAFCKVAYPHDHRGAEESNPVSTGEARRMVINGKEYPYFDGLKWPSVATVADLPATAIPIGTFIEGMPLGVQVIGPYLEDRTPLRFAQLLEDALGGSVPPPGFA